MTHFIRSGPTNSRAVWHISNPLGHYSNSVLCGRAVTGPRANSLRQVKASVWPLCDRCLHRREEKVAEAEALLAALDLGGT
jgi:hypothetical protein